MPKRMKFFADKKKAKKYRNHQRLQNYRRGNFGGDNKNRYSEKEIEMIMEHGISDRELAKILSRSVSSIQTKRMRVKRGYY